MDNSVLVWLLQYIDAVVNWGPGFQLAPGQQRWAKGKWTPATAGSGEPNLFPTQDGTDVLTLPGEVPQSRMWRREAHFFSGTAETRQGKMEQLIRDDTERVGQQLVFGEGQFSL